MSIMITMMNKIRIKIKTKIKIKTNQTNTQQKMLLLIYQEAAEITETIKIITATVMVEVTLMEIITN